MTNMRCVFDLGSWTTWLSCSSAMPKLCLLLFWLRLGASHSQDYQNFGLDPVSYTTAMIRYTYVEPSNDTHIVIEKEMGRYGLTSSNRSEEGLVVHVEEEETGLNHGCTPYMNNIPTGRQHWVALVQRGACKFQQKIHQALLHNASAIVIYNNVPEDDLLTMLHNETHIVTVFIGNEDGETIARLVDSGVQVLMNISAGEKIDLIPPPRGPNILHTALLLTFVGLLIIGLVVVVVYAVRHAKQVHAKHQARMNPPPAHDQQSHDHLIPMSTSNGTADVTIQTRPS